jgi:hypothetical protein
MKSNDNAQQPTVAIGYSKYAAAGAGSVVKGDLFSLYSSYYLKPRKIGTRFFGSTIHDV